LNEGHNEVLMNHESVLVRKIGLVYPFSMSGKGRISY
jgi:hypothetical protein